MGMNFEPVMTYQQIGDAIGVCPTQAMKEVRKAIRSARIKFEELGYTPEWLVEHSEDRGYE